MKKHSVGDKVAGIFGSWKNSEYLSLPYAGTVIEVTDDGYVVETDEGEKITLEFYFDVDTIESK